MNLLLKKCCPTLLLILLFAFAIRFCWVNNVGCSVDLQFFVDWMRNAAQGGIIQSYTATNASYPPLTVFVLWILGKVFSQNLAPGTAPQLHEVVALRLIITLVDLVTLCVIYVIIRRYRSRREALLLTLGYALNPNSILLAGWWGQTEAWYVLPMLLGLWWLASGQVNAAWVALTLAVAFKQTAIVVIPLCIIGTWRWYGWGALMRALLILGGLMFLIMAPLLLSGHAATFYDRAIVIVNSFPYVALESHNLWYALDVRARAIGADFNHDHNVFLLGVTYHDWGLALLSLSYATLLTWLFRRCKPRDIFAVAALGWMCFFMFPTCIHARYLYPALACLLLAGIQYRLWYGIYFAATFTMVINLLARACAISPDTCPGPFALPESLYVINACVNLFLVGIAFVALFQQTARTSSVARGFARVKCGLPTACGNKPTDNARWIQIVSRILIPLAWGGLLIFWGIVFLQARALWHQLKSIEAPLLQSLHTARTGDTATMLINYPRQIEVQQTRFSGGVPVTSPALFMEEPQHVVPALTSVQYAPWQHREGTLQIVAYHGALVTQEELRSLFFENRKTLTWDPYTKLVIPLAEYAPLRDPQSCTVVYGQNICLMHVQPNRSGKKLYLDLTWYVPHNPDISATVFVHVLNAEKQIKYQVDGDLVRGLIPLSALAHTNHMLRETRIVDLPLVLDDVRIGVYDRSSGKRFDAVCAPEYDCIEKALAIAIP